MSSSFSRRVQLTFNLGCLGTRLLENGMDSQRTVQDRSLLVKLAWLQTTSLTIFSSD